MRNRFLLCAISSFVIIGMMSVPAAGFGAFAHYRVAVEVKRLRPDLNLDPDYSMVPDAFQSKNWYGGISVGFTWSHAVQRVDGQLPPPTIPTYPDDDRYPGVVMYDLALNKIDYSNFADRQRAVSCALGDVAHNAADRIVHWQYFRGDGSLAYGANMWARNHCMKEEWADYVLLMLLDAGVNTAVDPGLDGVLGTDDDMEIIPSEELSKVFDASGNVKWSQIYGGMPAAGSLGSNGQMNFKIEPAIMHLGMKAHRKNRRNSDFGGISEFQVQTIAQIEAEAAEEMNAPGEEFALTVLRMNINRWQVLDFKSKNLQVVDTECGLPDLPLHAYTLFPADAPSSAITPWVPTHVLTKFNLCVQRAIGWIENLGN